MVFDLLNEPWIPVIRSSGMRERIPPWRITEPAHDPPVSLDYPRPDLAAGMLELLIGLVQTFFPPKNTAHWDDLLRHPPTSEILRKAMTGLEHAFDLFGPGPCFMQDLEMLQQGTGKIVPIGSLLIDTPGENAYKENTDFFVKRGRVDHLCPACGAAALFTMQAYAPSGGQGHRTSLRGGGPLTTVIMGKNLWECIWKNVLDMARLEPYGDTGKTWAGGVFPWLAASITSEKEARPVMPADVHPLHMYWGMPRRIRLIPQENRDQDPCSLCQETPAIILTEYATLPRGYNYEGGFCHPLSPTVHEDNKAPYHVHGSPSGVRYRHWLGLVDPLESEKKRRYPALVVSVYRGRLNDMLDPEDYFRILAHGYDMDNMKARAWNEGAIPVYEVSSDLRGDYAAIIGQWVETASEVGGTLRTALRKALVDPHNEIKPNNTLLGSYETRFWRDSEPVFFVLLPKLAFCVTVEDEDNLQVLREDWLKALCDHAHHIFDDAVLKWMFSPSEDQKRLATAWKELRAFASVRNNKLRKILELPKVEKAKPKG